MSLPTVEKTWQYNVNNQITALGSALANNRRILRLIKEALKGAASGAWTVRGSSDGVAFNMSGTDLWDDDSDLIFVSAAGTAHSWIVLRQIGMGAAGVEILIDLVTGGSTQTTAGSGAVIRIASVEDGGFTGGSITTAPTATNQQILNTGIWTQLGTDAATRWNVIQADNGSGTRVWAYSAGVLQFLWVFEAPTDKVSAWNDAYVGYAAPGSVVTAANSYGYTYWKSTINNTLASIALSMEATSSGSMNSEAFCGNIPNDLTSEYVILPIGICCNTTTVRGRHGIMPDMWYASTGTVQGDTYPADGSANFVNVGPFVFPWNGGAVNLT